MATNTLNKHVSPEARTFGMDFRAFPEILAGETIASALIDSATPSGLTIGTPVISGSKVLFTIQDGTAGNSYSIVVRIVTSSGAVITEKGTLTLTNP